MMMPTLLVSALLMQFSFAAPPNDFALTMYDSLKGEKGNVVFSPYGVESVLAMAEVGAAGKTKDALVSALGFEAGDEVSEKFRELRAALAGDSKSGCLYEDANALWPDQRFSIKPEFVSAVERDFGAKPEPLDFHKPAEAAARINAWASEKTHKKIPQLVDAGSVNGASLVLTNAVYFKGAWQDQFKEKETTPQPFALGSGGRPKVPMMYQFKKRQYAETKDAQVVVLPYKGNFEMVVVLPKTKDGLGKVSLANALGALSKGKRREVRLQLPKFKIEVGFDLTETLKALGLGILLDKPDLSGVSEVKGLQASKLIQKAFIEVNEIGTEAAAATAMVFVATAMMNAEPPVEFTVDHPFAFALRHSKSGKLLFLGRVLDPRAK